MQCTVRCRLADIYDFCATLLTRYFGQRRSCATDSWTNLRMNYPLDLTLAPGHLLNERI